MDILMFLVCLLFACENVQNSSEAPEKTQQNITSTTKTNIPENPKENIQKQQTCVEACVESKQMEARSIDSIKSDCEKGCKNQPSPLSPANQK